MTVTIAGLTGKEIVDLCKRAQDRDPEGYRALLDKAHLWNDLYFLEQVKKLASVA